MKIPKYFQWIIRGILLLLVISLGANYLIQYALHAPARQKASKAGPKQPPANEAAFRSALAAGTQAFSDGRYTDALDRFLDAEHTASQLSDDQYNALKEARSQLAKTYEDGGDTSSAQRVYQALAACANHQAQIIYNSKEYETALARAQDGEELSTHLNSKQSDYLRPALQLAAWSLIALKRYDEASDTQQKMIDVLKSAQGDNSSAVITAYSGLTDIYARAQNWHGFEQTLNRMIDECDAAGPRERMMRSWAQYNLIIAYYREGDADTALSKADQFYAEYAVQSHDSFPVSNVAYQPNQFASLALQIATESKMPEAMDSWKKKGGTLPGGITVIALHPYQQH